MLPKNAVNAKSMVAKARKLAREAEMEELEARRKEDQEWRPFEVPKSRAAQKREEKAERRAEAAVRRAEARWLAEEEAKKLEMERRGQKKVTEGAQQCLSGLEGAEKAKAHAKPPKRKITSRGGATTSEIEYVRMVSMPNMNGLIIDDHDSNTETEGNNNTPEEATAELVLKDHRAMLMVEMRYDTHKENRKAGIQKRLLQSQRWSNHYFDDDD